MVVAECVSFTGLVDDWNYLVTKVFARLSCQYAAATTFSSFCKVFHCKQRAQAMARCVQPILWCQSQVYTGLKHNLRKIHLAFPLF